MTFLPENHNLALAGTFLEFVVGVPNLFLKFQNDRAGAVNYIESQGFSLCVGLRWFPVCPYEQSLPGSINALVQIFLVNCHESLVLQPLEF